MSTNSDRAAWASHAIDAFNTVVQNEPGKVSQASDLISNLIHFLRIECKLSIDQAAHVAEMAISMARIETTEDRDY